MASKKEKNSTGRFSGEPVKVNATGRSFQSPCRAASTFAFKAQCIPPAQLVVLILAAAVKKTFWYLKKIPEQLILRQH